MVQENKSTREMVLEKLSEVGKEIVALLQVRAPDELNNIERECCPFAPILISSMRLNFMNLLDFVGGMTISDEELDNFASELERCAPEGDRLLCDAVAHLAEQLRGR